MEDRKYKEKTEYVESILRAVGNKLTARRLDELGLLGDRVEFTIEEDLAYEYVMLKSDNQEQVYVTKRYWSFVEEKHGDIQKELGISENTYYRVRRRAIEGIDDYLVTRGFGYVNASNVDRLGLPSKLTYGQYKVIGDDLIYEDQEYGDWHDITNGAVDIQRYNTIKVVESLNLILKVSGNTEQMEIPDSDCVLEAYDLLSYGLGIVVNEKYNGQVDLLTTFDKIEEVLDHESVDFDYENETLYIEFKKQEA